MNHNPLSALIIVTAVCSLVVYILFLVHSLQTVSTSQRNVGQVTVSATVLPYKLCVSDLDGVRWDCVGNYEN